MSQQLASAGVVARVVLPDFAHPSTDASTRTREEREGGDMANRAGKPHRVATGTEAAVMDRRRRISGVEGRGIMPR